MKQVDANNTSSFWHHDGKTLEKAGNFNPDIFSTLSNSSSFSLSSLQLVKKKCSKNVWKSVFNEEGLKISCNQFHDKKGHDYKFQNFQQKHFFCHVKFFEKSWLNMSGLNINGGENFLHLTS